MTVTKHIASSIGCQALRLLTISKRWLIVEVYRNCLYCADNYNNIICIGSETIGRGPFVINGIEITELVREGLASGDSLSSKRSGLYLDNTGRRIVLSRAKTWDARFSDTPHDCSAVERDAHVLAERARRSAPADGLGPLIPAILSGQDRHDTHTPADRLSRLLQHKVLDTVAATRKPTWRKDALQAGHLTEVLRPMIGCGPGLTPSGDDFCAGVVLGLARTKKNRAAEELALALYEHARGRTTQISLAYYRALAETYVSEHQANLLDSFGNGARTDQALVMSTICNQGATSGWDMLAGFIFGLSLDRQPSTLPVSGPIAEMAC